MTHDTPPKRIWADPPETFDGMDVWRSEPGGKGIPYILASDAEAMVEAALRGAAEKVRAEAKVSPYLSGMTEAFQRGLSDGFEAAAQIVDEAATQPASAALDKLISEAVKVERKTWRKGLAVSKQMVREAQAAYDANPEYGLTDEDMAKAIFAALRTTKGAQT